MGQVSPLDGFFLTTPRILEGESISGYIARAAPYSTHPNVQLILRQQNKMGHRLAWLFPSGLEQWLQLLGPGLPALEEVVNNHTLLPLLRPFLPLDVTTRLRSHYLGSFVHGIAAACGFSPHGMSSRWNLNVCRACITEDTDLGFSYWRTGHLVPGLAVCPYHLEPLFTYCKSCASGFRHSRQVWLPRESCVCGNDLIPVRIFETTADRNVEEAISEMVQQVLAGGIPDSVGYNTTLKVISWRAKELGYGGAGGVIRIRALLEEKVGLKVLKTHRVSTGEHTVFRMSLSGARLPRNPIHNLILIYTLFDNIDVFVEASLREQPLENVPLYFLYAGTKVKRRLGRKDRYARWNQMSEDEIRQLKDTHRPHILKLKAEIPHLRRSLLNRVGAREAYAFLLRFDKQWLDEALPCIPFNPRRVEKYQCTRTKEVDDSLAKHIYARQKQLLDAQLPARITHRRLLYGHHLESNSKTYFEQLPNTRLALKTCTETLDQWHIRQTAMLIEQAFAASPHSPFDRNLELSNLNEKQLINLKGRIRTWLRKNASI